MTLSQLNGRTVHPPLCQYFFNLLIALKLINDPSDDNNDLNNPNNPDLSLDILCSGGGSGSTTSTSKTNILALINNNYYINNHSNSPTSGSTSSTNTRSLAEITQILQTHSWVFQKRQYLRHCIKQYNAFQILYSSCYTKEYFLLEGVLLRLW